MEKLSLSFVENHHAYIGVGSNLGNKRWFCLRAIEEMSAINGVTVKKRASLYRSPPLGEIKQDWYVNTVVHVETSLKPRELLAALHLIELQLWRTREVKWGPRTIDLDLLFYDDQIIQENGLTLPHSEAHTRHFVLMPLAEIAPKLIHPIFKQPVSDILETLPDKSECFPLASHDDLPLNRDHFRQIGTN